MMSEVASKNLETGSQNRFIELSLSDTRLDNQGAYFSGAPLNTLPKLCSVCGFPDLDYIPQPYFILRGPAMTTAEAGESSFGCLLVKGRVKTIIELVLPGQCRFFKTSFARTLDLAPWWLAVPVNRCRTGVIKPSIPRCDACGEFLSGHPGTEYQEWRTVMDAPESLKGDVFLSLNWGSTDTLNDGGHQGRLGVGRFFVCSVRFYCLLRKLNVAGVYESGGKETPPDDDEVAWVNRQIVGLRKAGVSMEPLGAVSRDSKKWFKRFLKENGGPGTNLGGVAQFEKKHKVRFPKSYLEFIEKVGGKHFENIDSKDGQNVNIFALEECDYESFRKGQLDVEDEESRSVDGLMFAETDFGDCFCFDLKKDRKESEIFIYRHEYNCFEPYSANFIECLKRFTADEAGEDS